MKVFENRALRKIFGRKREEVTGEWIRLRNGEIFALLLTKYYWGDQIKKSDMMKACGTYGESRDACNVLMGNPVRKRLLGIPRHTCEYNIKMVVQELGWGSLRGLIWLRIGTGGGLL